MSSESPLPTCPDCGVAFEHDAHRLDHCDQDCALIADLRRQLTGARAALDAMYEGYRP